MWYVHYVYVIINVYVWICTLDYFPVYIKRTNVFTYKGYAYNYALAPILLCVSKYLLSYKYKHLFIFPPREQVHSQTQHFISFH